MYTATEEEEEWNKFVNVYQEVASMQGCIAYFFMSLHAVNPYLIEYFGNFDPYPYLWVNMVYGIAVMIYSRPSLQPVSRFNKIAFGILGSLMFNHSSMLVYSWLTKHFSCRFYLLSCLGLLSGRIMIIHLLAFLYHMDTRSNISGTRVPRNSTYEGMYSR